MDVSRAWMYGWAKSCRLYSGIDPQKRESTRRAQEGEESIAARSKGGGTSWKGSDGEERIIEFADEAEPRRVESASCDGDGSEQESKSVIIKK